jgi:hypothetical protein
MKYLKILFVFCFIGCTNYHSKKHYVRTYNLCENKSECPCKLYAEGYLVYTMGAQGSNLYSEYLTDSSMFRIYTGTYDEYDEQILYNCKGDSIYVEKITHKDSPTYDPHSFKVLDKKVYSLKALKSKHILE